MEETIKKLNWIYYGQMALSLIALTIMYYSFNKGLFEPLDVMSSPGKTIQFIIIIDAMITIPLGLYLVKMCKPKTDKMYFKLAALRILLASNAMFFGIIAFYLMGGYKPMLWVAAISAIGWYFSKPTLGKMYQEMKPEDPNEETY